MSVGIERQLSIPYAHQQNGKAEWAIRTIEGRLFAMLETANLPPTLWGEAVLTVCYLWNGKESSTLPPGITPYEVVNNQKPDLSHLHVWGARCFAHIPIEQQIKLGPHSHIAYFMGYSDGTKGYCLQDADTGVFFSARDVLFDKNFASVSHFSSLDSSDKDDAPLVQQVPTASTPLTAPPPITQQPSDTHCSSRP